MGAAVSPPTESHHNIEGRSRQCAYFMRKRNPKSAHFVFSGDGNGRPPALVSIDLGCQNDSAETCEVLLMKSDLEKMDFLSAKSRQNLKNRRFGNFQFFGHGNGTPRALIVAELGDLFPAPAGARPPAAPLGIPRERTHWGGYDPPASLILSGLRPGAVSTRPVYHAL